MAGQRPAVNLVETLPTFQWGTTNAGVGGDGLFPGFWIDQSLSLSPGLGHRRRGGAAGT